MFFRSEGRLVFDSLTGVKITSLRDRLADTRVRLYEALQARAEDQQHVTDAENRADTAEEERDEALSRLQQAAEAST